MEGRGWPVVAARRGAGSYLGQEWNRRFPACPLAAGILESDMPALAVEVRGGGGVYVCV